MTRITRLSLMGFHTLTAIVLVWLVKSVSGSNRTHKFIVDFHESISFSVKVEESQQKVST